MSKSEKCTKIIKFNPTLSDFYRKLSSSKALLLNLVPGPKEVQNIFSILEMEEKLKYRMHQGHFSLYSRRRKKVNHSKDTVSQYSN